jgi:hypothetical protein
MTRLRIGPGVGATFACLLGVSAFVPANAVEVTGQNQHGVMSDRVTFRVES